MEELLRSMTLDDLSSKFDRVIKCIQINLNRSWGAYDLLKQRILESKMGLAILSEPPNNIVDSNRWFCSTDRLAAILWNVESSKGYICRLIKKGIGFVAVRYGNINVISCYISPNVTMIMFEDMLEDINNCVSALTGPCIIGGDFNAKSVLWGSPDTNRRGELLERWTASYDLRLLNEAGVFTCIRPQGSSVVDLTWISPVLIGRVVKWSVRGDLESLSDHLYVEFGIEIAHRKKEKNDKCFNNRRWNFKKMDQELFTSSLEFLANVELAVDIARTPELYSAWLIRIMKDACNVSTPKIFIRNNRRSAYWWSEEISGLRTAAIGARRCLTRHRRRGAPPADVILAYRAAKRALRSAIKKAKNNAWKELIDSIDKDPWGLPYKLVMSKLRKSSPTFSETIDRDILEKLIESLFPNNLSARSVREISIEEWTGELDVNAREIQQFVKKRVIKNTAPGPDNLKAITWKRAPQIVMGHLANLFTLCMREGVFPDLWKRAILVLIPKGSVGISMEIKARPICLLDEAGKIFERIIADRINRWLNENPDSSLSDNQFGFRKNRSTVDALVCVKNFTQNTVSEGGAAIAVGLDIKNAFNSIPWATILRAMEDKGIPGYLRRLVGDYLSHRSIIFRTSDGRTEERAVRAGVPQGSVLGPLLWNVAYDSVLRLRLEKGCCVICYADDTLVISTSNRIFGAVVNVNLQLARVVRHIMELGLTISEVKTEAVLFTKKKLNIMPSIKVGDSSIMVNESMKYLGIMIDRNWSFWKHFNYIEDKLNKVTRALNRLMPNLHGPGERKRQLYAKVMTSVVMYAAPVWGDALASSPERILRPLRRLQRTVAIRVVAAYRTVSFDAATLLARMPPWVLEASFRKRVFYRISESKRLGLFCREEEENIKKEENILLLRQWDVFLNRPDTWGQKTVRAILPHMRNWLERRHGEITFHASQMFTGHGSFGHFLWRIGKKETPECFHCQYQDDTLEHTLSECPVWDNVRYSFREALELAPDAQVTLEVVMAKILEKKSYWSAFIEFSTYVLRLKEEEERRRERSMSSHSSLGS